MQRGAESHACKVAMNTLRSQILVLKKHYLLRGIWVSWRNGTFSSGSGNVQDEPGTFSYDRNKEVHNE